MDWFSEREGLKQTKPEIQINSMNESLRKQLWNVIDGFIMNKRGEIIYINPHFEQYVFKRIWTFYFKETADTMPINSKGIYEHVRNYFFTCDWYEVYDFLEALVYFQNQVTNGSRQNAFQLSCNQALENERSAFRFVNSTITPISSKQEISEIEEAINCSIKVVNLHLQNALRLFSDKNSPDYRNSIKESISAVEAICKLIANKPNTTLGTALNVIEKEAKIPLHPALKNAFTSMYHYTSDADGIRHSLKDDKVSSSFEEAKYMLVTCSAFVNYLISKASKAGLKL